MQLRTMERFHPRLGTRGMHRDLGLHIQLQIQIPTETDLMRNLKFGLEAWSVVLTCIWRILPEAGSMHSVEAAIAVWGFYTYRATLHLWIGGMPRIKKCPWRLGL